MSYFEIMHVKMKFGQTVALILVFFKLIRNTLLLLIKMRNTSFTWYISTYHQLFLK